MNTFCHTLCCIYVQLNRQCCETHGIVIIQIIWYMPHVPSVFRGSSFRSIPQLGVRFLADNKSWNVNGTPNFRTVKQMLKSTEPDSFWYYSCTAERTCFNWVIKNQIFYFQVNGNLLEENIKYQQLQKICREKLFSGKVKEIWAKYILQPKRWPAPTPMPAMSDPEQ